MEIVRSPVRRAQYSGRPDKCLWPFLPEGGRGGINQYCDWCGFNQLRWAICLHGGEILVTMFDHFRSQFSRGPMTNGSSVIQVSHTRAPNSCRICSKLKFTGPPGQRASVNRSTTDMFSRLLHQYAYSLAISRLILVHRFQGWFGPSSASRIMLARMEICAQVLWRLTSCCSCSRSVSVSCKGVGV